MLNFQTHKQIILCIEAIESKVDDMKTMATSNEKGVCLIQKRLVGSLFLIYIFNSFFGHQ